MKKKNQEIGRIENMEIWGEIYLKPIWKKCIVKNNIFHKEFPDNKEDFKNAFEISFEQKKKRLEKKKAKQTQLVQKIIFNKIQCNHCGDIIESKYRHDFRECSCGTVFVDGGKDYLRRGFKHSDDYIDLSKTKQVRSIIKKGR